MNFFNKRNHKNRKKGSGKKRRIFASDVLAVKCFKTQKHSNATPVIQGKVISAQEFNSLDDSRNSDQTIRTGNGTILEFQQEVSNASSNKNLSNNNLNEPDDIILVKGDGGLPDIEAFLLSLPQRTGSQKTTGMNRQNPVQGGGGVN